MKMVKFTGGFFSPLEFGQVIIIGGKIKENAENFTLNLLSDNSLDIPLHMNVVFGENGQIIRNTKINGEFGVAENIGGMLQKVKNPLKAGERDFLSKVLSTYCAITFDNGQTFYVSR